MIPTVTEIEKHMEEHGQHSVRINTDGTVELRVGLDTPTQVFFYEHDFYVFSNFSAFSLKNEHGNFPTSEHAYHYAKFLTDKPNTQLLWDIRHAPSAHEAFKIAERHKDERRPDWDDVKADVMFDILRTKAAQHEYVRRKLFATGDRELIENSWRDDYWGWGPHCDGQNMLGLLWMRVRNEMRSVLEAAPDPFIDAAERAALGL